jgi:putative ABC transport system substrate-binding protein
VSGGDPVNLGLVANLNRPRGNVTGVASFGVPLGAKRLELLHQLLPDVTVIALLVNPTNPSAEFEQRDGQAAAEAIGLQMLVQNASAERDLDTAFTNLVQQRTGALLVGADGFFNGQRHKIAALAARHAIPTIYELREFTMAGGLLSYGPSFSDLYRQAGIYAGRILKGAKPGDLPVMLPTKFELVINLKTAKSLGLTVPPTLLARAGEVIE